MPTTTQAQKQTTPKPKNPFHQNGHLMSTYKFQTIKAITTPISQKIYSAQQYVSPKIVDDSITDDVIDSKAYFKCDQPRKPRCTIDDIKKKNITNNLLHYSKDVLILDNLKINQSIKIVISLRPKFIFPSQPSDSNYNIGLYISAIQTADIFHFNHGFTEKEYRDKIYQANNCYYTTLLKKQSNS